MKTITIVAIIAAVAVVGAACIGIPLSGVLNGGTTGPGGDDPVEPTPTETPTETPTPTDSSMSYFSPMTSSSSSSSSSGNTLEPTPTETPEEPTTITIPGNGVVRLPADAISDSPVSSMIFPDGYAGGTVTITPVSNSPGSPEGTHLTVEIDLSTPLSANQEVTINFKIPKDDVADLNSVVLYHYGGKPEKWTPLPTVHIGTDDSSGLASFQATATEFSPFAVVFCTHNGESKYSAADTDGMHKKICSICNVVKEKSCSYEDAEYVSLANDNHKRTCTVCKLTVETEECSSEEDTVYHVDGTETHGKKCTSCGDFIVDTVKSCSEFEYEQVKDTGASKHNKKCTACSETYTGEACTSTGEITKGDGTHGLECTLCHNTFNGVLCTFAYVHDDGAETHTKKCTTCGQDSTPKEENVACTYSLYTWNRDTNEHTAKCKDCGHVKAAEACTYADGFVQVDGVTHKSNPCAVCKNVKTDIPCTYGEFTASDSGVQHSKECTGCGAVIEETCSYNYETATQVKDTTPNQHTYKCNICDNGKTVMCKATSSYIQNEKENTHSLTCDKCGTALQNEVYCFTEYTDSPAEAPTTRTCECGRTAKLVASIEEGSDIAYYISVKDAVAAVNDNTKTSVKIIVADEYDIHEVVMTNKDITIKGSKDIVLNYTAQQGVNGVPDMTGTNLTFDGVTVKWSDANEGHQGIKNPNKVVYKNCIIYGTQFMYSGADFIGCTFETKDGYAVYTRAPGDYTFTDCTFNTGGRAIMMYNDAPIIVNVTLTNCIFSDNGTYTSKDKAVVETGDFGSASVFNIYLNDCSITKGFETNNSNSPLWGNKDKMPTDRLSVFIDNVMVYGKKEELKQ